MKLPPFRFCVISVNRLPRARVAVIEGTVQSGSVRVGDELVLQHGDLRMPLTVHGVAMGGAHRPPDSLKLLIAVKVSEPAAAVVEPGNLLTRG